MTKRLSTEYPDESLIKVIDEAIRRYDFKRREESRKRKFHNTRLLLEHYNDLKDHVNNAIDDVNKLDVSSIDISDMDKEDLYILSIKRSKTKTLIMISHIDMALETLKQKENKLCSKEKYEVLKMFYIDEIDYDAIVKELNCGVNTPRRWINEMINELSILLFGIDGLKMDMV